MAGWQQSTPVFKGLGRSRWLDIPSTSTGDTKPRMEDAHYLALTGKQEERVAPFFDARKLFRKRSLSLSASRVPSDTSVRPAQPRRSMGSTMRPASLRSATDGSQGHTIPEDDDGSSSPKLLRKHSRPISPRKANSDEPPTLSAHARASTSHLSRGNRPQSSPILPQTLLSVDLQPDISPHGRRSISSVSPASATVQVIPPPLPKKKPQEAKPMSGGPHAFKMKNDQPHHPLTRFVPYPKSYTHQALDSDVWSSLAMIQMAKGLTCHKFGTPPLKVLDIGCGTGTWVLQCAALWPNTHFTGVDLVPIQPKPSDPLVESPQDADRIVWVKANVMETLPFPDSEFDYVRISRLAGGIPESNWDELLADVARVMKPGAAFEMLEEELYFPGKTRDSPDSSTESSLSYRSTPAHSSSSVAVATASRAVSPYGAIPPEPSQDEIAQKLAAMGLIELGGPGALAIPGIASFQMSSTSLGNSSGSSKGSRRPGTRQTETENTVPYSNQEGKQVDQPLVYTTETAPLDPRDHTVLTAIWDEMHMFRFINLHPLSILSSSISTYFTNIRTHAPITFLFPPKPSKHAYYSKRESASSVPFILPPPSPAMSGDGSLSTPGFHGLTPKRTSHSSRTFILEESLADARISLDLPACTLEPDPNAARMHLRVRVGDVNACAESMWEWVVAFQAKYVPPSPGQPVPSAIHHTVSELKRVDFDRLLRNFNFDMSDHMGLDQETMNLGWNCSTKEVSEDRRAYDDEVQLWKNHCSQRPSPSVGTIPTLLRKGSDHDPEERMSRTIRIFCAFKGKE